ncbi:MAG: hypothetical protein ACI9LV_000227 [Candidatus Nanohaloarchaea archaeon]|jgi:hypothetical protein
MYYVTSVTLNHKKTSFFLIMTGVYLIPVSLISSFLLFATTILIQDKGFLKWCSKKSGSQSSSDFTGLHLAALSLGMALVITNIPSEETLTERKEPDKVSYQEYRELQQEYNRSVESYKQLQDEYSSLYNRSRIGIYPPYVVAHNRTFEVAFNYSDGEKDYYLYDGETFSAQIMNGNYMREMSVQQMKYLDLDYLADRFKNDTKYRELGDYGTYYQLEPFIVPENFEHSSHHIYSKYDSDKERVREVWNVVTQVNTYSPELEETPRMPLETLLMGGGDCEDTAILAASMLEAMPADWDVKLLYMDSNNPQNPENINHVLVYVDTGDYQTFIETTSDTEMNPYEEVEGYYVDIGG